MTVFLAWLIVGIFLSGSAMVKAGHVADTEWSYLLFITIVLAMAVTYNAIINRRTIGIILLALVLGYGSALHAFDPQEEALPSRFVNSSEGLLEGTVTDRENRTDSVQLTIETEGHNVLLSVYHQPAVTARPGDLVRVAVRLNRPKKYHVPGSFDYAAFLQRQGIVATAYAKSGIEIIGQEEGMRWNRWRFNIVEAIHKTLGTTQAEALTEALLLGYRGRINGEVREAFQSAGIFHLIAISGVQLSVAAGGTFYLLRLALALCWPLSRRMDVKPIAALLAFGPLISYGYLAGWSISTQRAVVMSALFLLAMTTGRRNYSWHAITLAAIVLLLLNPNELFDPGFQLSFIATASILWTARFVVNHFAKQPKCQLLSC